jgi:hypothetical protein
MADRQTILKDNQVERERLEDLVKSLKPEDFVRGLPNGWTVTVALAHLAFWDLTQVTRLKRWMEKGVKPQSMDAEVMNGPLADVTAGLHSLFVSKLVVEAARETDQLIEDLTPAQFEELAGMGLERNLHRAQHRRAHLPKIEEAIQVK